MQIKTKLTLLAGACLAAVGTQSLAQSVTIYGRSVMSVNQVETGSTNKVTELRDNASRLGFRGVEDLGGGMSALFGLEMGISSDSGATTSPVFRNSYVGLRGNWGTLALGRLDSANPTGSPIYSQITSLSQFAPNDAGATASSTTMQNARNRTSDSIGYASPKMGDLTFRARVYFRGAGTVTEPEDAAKATDLGLEYQSGQLKAAIAYAKDSRAGGLKNNEFSDKWQVGVNYQVQKEWDVYLLGGLDTYKNTSTTRQDVEYTLLGTSYTVGQHKVVLNTMKRDVQSSLTGVRTKNQLSYQYFLSKRTDLQAFIDNDSVDSSRSNVKVRAIGLGVRHNF
jgi:predicted porin